MPGRERENGAALLVALVLMVAVAIAGVSAVQAALDDEKSARHERDRELALRAAEAALADAERDIERADPSSPRLAAIAGAGFLSGCGQAGSDNHGLCAALAPPAWQAIDLAGSDPALVLYGTFSARSFGAALAAPPRYLIEPVALDAAYGRFYRITALGFGVQRGAQVVLQSFYRKVWSAPAATPAHPYPTGRLGWREVANWPALHAAAVN